MQALRLNEVLMRVVAWHNRHPLARRITATQVHSIGEVVLPFASAQAAPVAPDEQAAAGVPALRDLLDPPASDPVGLTASTDAPTDIVNGADADTPDAAALEALPADELPLGHPLPEAPGDAAQASPADPANPADPRFDEPADAPGEGLPEPVPEPEVAPVLSMEEEADKLFSTDEPAAADPPNPAADIAPEAADNDGPELLIEQTADADEAADTSPTPPEPPVEDSTPQAPASPTDTDTDTDIDTAPLADAPGAAEATDADSAELTAAFAAATADDPLPAIADEAAAPSPADSPQHPATAEAAPASQAPWPDLHGTEHTPASAAGDAPPSAEPGEAHPDAAHPASTALAAEAPHAAAPAAAAFPAPPGAATAPPPGWFARLRAWLQSWRPGRASHGLPKLQATFSRDFIWPLRPAQVAGWARRHGSLQTLAPPDWPQRLIDTDPRLQTQARSQGLPHQLPLHVLTAAIGVGDRRIRVLIDAQGHILGPRAYSPPRLAALASVVALGLVGAGWGGLPRGDSLSAKQASAAVAAAASAAAQAASAAALAAAAASAAESVWLAQRAEAGLTHPTAAESPGAEAPGAGDDGNGPAGSPAAASAPEAEPADTAARASNTAAPDHGAAAQHAPEPAQAADTAPEHRAASTIAKATLGPVLPALSPADKQVARQQALALRGDKAAAAAAAPPQPPAKVYAVVSQLTRDKQSAARSLGLMRASNRRLGDEAPAHGELMQDQGAWRAAWWPFENQADAERARVMLAARGVPCEVVEF